MIDFADAPLLLPAISKNTGNVDADDIVCDNIRCGCIIAADEDATGASFQVCNGADTTTVAAVLCLACVERLKVSTTVEIMRAGHVYAVPIKTKAGE
jgi:hypothetical protein